MNKLQSQFTYLLLLQFKLKSRCKRKFGIYIYRGIKHKLHGRLYGRLKYQLANQLNHITELIHNADK